MRKTISFATVLIFLASIYITPTVSAITLGEIKPEKSEDLPVKKSDAAEALNKKVPSDNKPDEKTEKPVEEKEEINPRLVCLLSVIMPGGGHFYLNHDAKGIGFCLAAGVGYTATGYFMVKTMLADPGSVAFKNHLLLGGFLFFITIIIHFVGIIEAYSDADELSKEKLFGDADSNPYVTKIVMK